MLVRVDDGRAAVGWHESFVSLSHQAMSRLGAASLNSWAERSRGGRSMLRIRRRQKHLTTPPCTGFLGSRQTGCTIPRGPPCDVRLWDGGGGNAVMLQQAATTVPPLLRHLPVVLPNVACCAATARPGRRGPHLPMETTTRRSAQLAAKAACEVARARRNTQATTARRELLGSRGRGLHSRRICSANLPGTGSTA